MTKFAPRSFALLWVAAVAATAAACSSESPGTPQGTGGAGVTGGVSNTGGQVTSNGGSLVTGGNVGSGGTSASGGSTATGGSVSTGGASATGGAQATGGAASGGATNTGGSAGSSAGKSSTGGAPGGGRTGTGGAATGGTFGGAGAAGGSTGGKGSAGSTGASGGSGGGGTFHVFLLFGQSNMAGYAKATAADKVENARIQVLGFDSCSATGRTKDQWDTAAPPLHECGVGAVGPGDWFSKTLLDKLPAGDTIGLVPCALSGQAIAIFSKGTDKYTWMVNRVKNAQQKGGKVEGLLFHQGESDCGNSQWPAKVKQLVTDLRTDLSLGDTPLLAGELPYDSACTNHNPLVNQLPGMITNAYVVSAKDLKLDPADTEWHMHFGHDDTVEFGKRYAAKMIEVLKL